MPAFTLVPLRIVPRGTLCGYSSQKPHFQPPAASHQAGAIQGSAIIATKKRLGFPLSSFPSFRPCQLRKARLQQLSSQRRQPQRRLRLQKLVQRTQPDRQQQGPHPTSISASNSTSSPPASAVLISLPPAACALSERRPGPDLLMNRGRCFNPFAAPGPSVAFRRPVALPESPRQTRCPQRPSACPTRRP